MNRTRTRSMHTYSVRMCMCDCRRRCIVATFHFAHIFECAASAAGFEHVHTHAYEYFAVGSTVCEWI